MQRFPAALVLALLIACAPAAHAWGPLGHRLVARLAEPQLTPAAHAEVQRLLATEGLHSLADVANWADDVRANDPDLGKRSAKWHYVNLGELGCRYDAPAACPRGDCAVEAIRAQAAILADRSRSDAERLQALKFLVHFVGDIHQPMHAGNARDRGGNTVQVQLHGKGTNLHRVWDGELLKSAGLDEEGYVRKLAATPVKRPVGGPAVTAADADHWAEASCRIAMAPGVVPPRAKLDARYLATHTPTAEAQVRLAGARLAVLIDDALVPARGAPHAGSKQDR
ncbi:S1/P1 nuclease [Luteimonas kalidii]|uniref:S1/P1 nuclease n=1 Tax=Luteimonas kalidii TaxID=3042025 RepID=A0ABT6JV56_9GAMM|nr:S1/P1 nuclease [Luteimonas kalidii]MDH5834573.1 S1/P1 nuclease [Luteimonas kalidii]